MAKSVRKSIVGEAALSEVKDDLSRYLREAEKGNIVITRHRQAGRRADWLRLGRRLVRLSAGERSAICPAYWAGTFKPALWTQDETGGSRLTRSDRHQSGTTEARRWSVPAAHPADRDSSRQRYPRAVPFSIPPKVGSTSQNLRRMRLMMARTFVRYPSSPNPATKPV